MNKKYTYSKCTKCGADKKTTTANHCGKCRTRSIYSKCIRCQNEKKPTGCGYCSACAREYAIGYRKHAPKPKSPYILIKELREQIVSLQNEIAMLKSGKLPEPAEPETPAVKPVHKTYRSAKGVIPYNPLKNKAIYKKENPRLHTLLDRIQEVRCATGVKPDIQQLIDFVEPIIKRKHWASFEELLRVVDFHDKLFDYETMKSGEDAICNMYRDLCIIYKQVKNGFENGIYS